ncbi:MAG: hypothetical protein GC160_13170 [Acidobacteria bacterium]|nr:hypothetical protein [Acidobacteriota bacterium]
MNQRALNRRDWLRLTTGAALSAGWLRAADGIPAHPRLLEFPPLSFEPPEPSKYRRELAHGAVAYLVEDHQLPLVTVSVTVKTGEYLEPEELTGLASMTGSQMRSGGTTSLSAREFDEEAAFLATNVGSSIGDTSGGGSVDCLAANLDRSLELFFDMLRHPGFDPQRFQIAKAGVLQSMERRNDDTGGIISREYRRLLRGDDFFSTREVTKATLEAITIEGMRSFHDRYFHPSSMIFSVSGDFDTDDMVKRLNAALEGDWPGSANPQVPDVPKPTYQPKPGVYMVEKPDNNQSQVRIGHLGIQRSNPDQIAVGIMNYILGGGGFSSRIMSRVRSDEGLAYSAGSDFSPGTYYPGAFTAYFQSENSRCAQAATLVLGEVERIRQEKVGQDELDQAKSYLTEIFPRYFATAGQVAGTFAEDEYTGREKDYWKNYRARVSAVTADDVLRVAQKYLMPDKMLILGVGDVKAMLAGNPDKPEFSFQKLAGGKEIEYIPLPDPMTMEYPKKG